MLHPFQKEALSSVQTLVTDYQSEDGILFVKIPTGAGKTLVAAYLVYDFVNSNQNNKVLWVAPDWHLIRQARDELEVVFGSADSFRKVGINTSDSAVRDLKTNTAGKVFFSSIHTCIRNQNDLLEFRDHLLVIVDEAHWGTDKAIMNSLFNFCHGSRASGIAKENVPIIGLTATPRIPENINYKMAYAISFSELVKQGYLAEPVINNIDTNIEVELKVDQKGDIDARSLAKLNTKQRNIVVIDVVRKVLSQNGRRGILFAPNIEHASSLFKKLTQLNISCSIVYGDNTNNEQMINDFRKGITNLMIAVNMLRQGFNVPEITDVFLVAPSTSEIAISQMIGRGSRIIENVKEKFFIHDFHDTLDDVTANKIFTSSDYFNKDKCATNGYQNVYETSTHKYPDTPHLINLDKAFGLIEGVQFIDNQTFELQFEISSPKGIIKFGTLEWQQGENILLTELEDVLGKSLVYDYGISCVESDRYDFSSKWHVEESRAAGWRICSPLLQGREQLLQVIEVFEALQILIEENKLFLIDHKCGSIQKFATNLNDPPKQLNALKAIARIESGLFTLVKPTRRYFYNESINEFNKKQTNHQCIPLSEEINFDAVAALIEFENDRNIDRSDRTSVCFSNIMRYPHLLEIRLHHSCLDPIKVVTWISLCMLIINSISREETTFISKVNKSVTYDDVFKLLDQEGVHLTEKTKSLLWQQRKVLSRQWKKVVPKKYDKWKKSNWLSMTR